jgi:prepilin-type N-terminal cleavage/methylation domain-containing protein
MRKDTNGYTLIELAVVMLILAISLTTVIPSFSIGSDQSRLRSSANRIASVAEHAHQRAACTRLTHILHIDTKKGTYWVTTQGLDGQDVSITDILSLKGQLPEGVSFLDIKIQGINTHSKDCICITLSPQGWADQATIRLRSLTGEIMSIMIDEFSGQVKTCKLESIF